MRSLENLTTLNNLRQVGESMVQDKLFILLSQFNEMLGLIKDEYEYFSLMTAYSVLHKFTESQFRQDLLNSSPEEMEEYISLKEESATRLYQNFLKENCS